MDSKIERLINSLLVKFSNIWSIQEPHTLLSFLLSFYFKVNVSVWTNIQPVKFYVRQGCYAKVYNIKHSLLYSKLIM